MSTVDLRLTELLQGLTHYQLELSQEAREIASTLQKDVLASILYGEDDAKEPAYALDFDKVEEMDRLTAAYTQLNAIDSGIRKKIEFHVTSIDSAIKDLTRARE